ncbi:MULTISPECIES: hypothetical protein [Burkholderia]|uniref:hypothetical protein n=1 Tax=Burkholderia TaxID=32008 RepID=UPI0015A70616|nr:MULTISPECIES: hypothetical protein [Burkholderia]
MDVFTRAQILRIAFRSAIFIEHPVYSVRYPSRAEPSASMKRGDIGGENRAHGTVSQPAGNAIPIRNAGARCLGGRLARSGDRATVALSGRACLLREAAERGMIDQFAMQLGLAGVRVFPILTFCQPCPSITRRFPVPSSCRSTRSCPKNRC